MPSTPSFAEVLRSSMRQDGIVITPANLSNLSGVSKATLANWLDGLVERPRRWQDILKVADALQLSESDTNKLLAAGGHQSIATLLSTATAADQASLWPWRGMLDLTPALGQTPNLAPPSTMLIGRDRERAAVRELVLRPEVQLVTLTGAGGTGKTLLALTTASELRAMFVDGVWLVPLAPLIDPHLVMPTIAQVLGVVEVPGTSLTERLADVLRTRQLLIVLDNFEHVLAAAPQVAELLAATPQLTLLVTSRSVLHLYGEYELSISPLALPDTNQRITPSEVARSPAVQLFVQRARVNRADFTLNASNAAAIAALCTRLDGLPLAIELAATGIATYTPEQLLAQLVHGLDTLQGDPEQLPARQQTLQATIDWSYNLLDDAARTLFTRLAVFMGGWTVEAAEAVCHDDRFSDQLKHMLHVPHHHPSTLDMLMTLADHSLITRLETSDGISRYTTLETLREYAAARLHTLGEFDRIKQRHAAYYLHWAQQLEPELTGPHQIAALMRLEDEHNNLRAALDWAVDQHQAETASRLGIALWRFWVIRGYLNEGRRWLEWALIKRHTLPAPVAVKALLAAGRLARQQADLAQAQTYLQAALDLEQERGDQQTIAFLLGSLGVVAYDQGHFARARQLHEQSLAIRRELNDQWGIAATLTNLGEVARQEGREAESQTLHEQSLALFQSLEDQSGTAIALLNLGQIVRQRGDRERALTLLHESLHLWQLLGEKVNIAECLEALADIAVTNGHVLRAAYLGGAAEAVRIAVGAPLAPAEQARYRELVRSIRAHLDRRRFAKAWQQGRSMSLEVAIHMALSYAETDS